MKTLTEFSGAVIKSTAQTRQELATSKTPEEMPQALGEAAKVEGDKLTLLLGALEAVGEKVGDLKRVIVFTLGEGEKAPSGAREVNGHFFLVEYYPPLVDKNAGRKFPGKHQGQGKKSGRGGRGGRGGREGREGRGRREGRGPKGPEASAK